MNQQIIQKLKKLSNIEPDPSFVEGSRRLILAMPPKRKSLVTFMPIWGWAGALALFILVTALSYISLISVERPTVSYFFNANDLSQEFNNLSINIQLEEINYQQEIDRVIASALYEISNTNSNHLYPPILK